MTMPLVETSLGSVAEQFIRECLSDGNTLAQEIAKRIQLTEGHITTLLPEGIVPISIEDFRAGGKLPTPPVSEWQGTHVREETLLMIPVPDTSHWITEKIRSHLARAKDGICIIEDALKRPQDPVLTNLATRYAIYKNEVYHTLFHDEARAPRIMEALRSARSVPTLVGCISTRPSGLAKQKGGAVSSEQLQFVAANAVALFIGAYDGEGYLYWAK